MVEPEVLSRQPPAEAPGIRVRGTRLPLPIVERLLQQWSGLAARRQRVATRGVQKYQAVALRSEPQRFVEASGAKPARPTRTPHLARSEGLAVPRRQCNQWARQAVAASAISFVKKWLPCELLGRRITWDDCATDRLALSTASAAHSPCQRDGDGCERSPYLDTASVNSAISETRFGDTARQPKNDRQPGRIGGSQIESTERYGPDSSRP